LGTSAYVVIGRDGDLESGHIPTREELENGYIPTQADVAAGYVPDIEDIKGHKFFIPVEIKGLDKVFIARKQIDERSFAQIEIVFNHRWEFRELNEHEYLVEPTPPVGLTPDDKTAKNLVFSYISQNKIKLAALCGLGIVAVVIAKYLYSTEKVSDTRSFYD
jgi:hypothetical protein